MTRRVPVISPCGYAEKVIDVDRHGRVSRVLSGDPADAAVDETGFPARRKFLLDRRLDLVLQLEPLVAEEFDPVVGPRVVRGGDHHAEGGAHPAGEKSHAGGRDRFEKGAVVALGEDAGEHRRLEHGAGAPRVGSDEHEFLVRVSAHHPAGGAPEPECEFGGHRLGVRHAAHAVGAEVFHVAGRRAGARPSLSAGAGSARFTRTPSWRPRRGRGNGNTPRILAHCGAR